MDTVYLHTQDGHGTIHKPSYHIVNIKCNLHPKKGANLSMISTRELKPMEENKFNYIDN